MEYDSAGQKIKQITPSGAITFFEYNELERLGKIIGTGKDILDIGANIGNHTLYFGKILKSHSIHAFEPVKDFYNILDKNVKSCLCTHRLL